MTKEGNLQTNIELLEQEIEKNGVKAAIHEFHHYMQYILNLFGRPHHRYSFTIKVPKLKQVEFASSIDPYEVAHKEQSHLGLHFCLLVFEFSL